MVSLIMCPECSKEVSEYATSCPHCGYQIQTQADRRGPSNNTESQLIDFICQGALWYFIVGPELLLIAVGTLFFTKSWIVFGSLVLLFTFGILYKPLAFFVLIIITAGWGAAGWLIGMYTQNIIPSVVLSILGVIFGFSIHCFAFGVDTQTIISRFKPLTARKTVNTNTNCEITTDQHTGDKLEHCKKTTKIHKFYSLIPFIFALISMVIYFKITDNPDGSDTEYLSVFGALTIVSSVMALHVMKNKIGWSKVAIWALTFNGVLIVKLVIYLAAQH